MMLVSTTAHASALASMASKDASRSRQTTINDHKQGLLANDAEAFGCTHSFPAAVTSLKAGNCHGETVRSAPGSFILAFSGSSRLTRHVPSHLVSQSLCGLGVIHQLSRPFQRCLTCWFNKCQQARTNSCHSVTRGAA